MSGKALAPLLLLCALACGCSKKEDKSSTVTTEDKNATPPAASTWQVSERGAGPMHIGMTIAQAESALAMRFPGADALGECGYVRPIGGPAGISFMVVLGQIARIDVDSTTVPTAAGARVGDTEARVQELYPGRVTVSPHKYTDGHYLIVGPASPSDDAYRLIFETDGTRVTRYRSGRLPEVEWIEGCS